MMKAATDADDRPKAKPAKKDSAPENATAAAEPVPAQRAVTPPITLNIFSVSDAVDKNGGEDSEASSGADEKAVPKRVAEASAPRAALWGQPRIQAEGSAANQVAQRGATEAQPDPERPLAVAASLADGSLSKIQPAFEAHLQAAEPQESPEPSSTATAAATPAASGKPEIPSPTRDNASAATAADAAPSVAQSAASNSKHGDGSHHPGQEKPQDPASNAPQPDASADLAQARFDVTAPVAPTGSTIPLTHEASRTETSAPTEAAPEPSTPQPAAAAPTAHDIKLELNDGGQRVEVRLTERGGDIHVAVRTPDARLSDAMRADLPALAAKLEQSGFRTDAWQPGSAAGGERRALETGAGNASQDSQEHAGQDQQQKQDNPQQQQQQRNLTNAPNRKSDRKDFAWLLQTYR